MKPAVVVVDMLEDAVKPFSIEIVPAINRLTRWARSSGFPVVFAMDSFLPGDFIFGGRMKEHCIRGTRGARVMDYLEQDASDIYVPKRRFSAFFKTDLDQTLHLYGVDTVAITGINTHWCVLNTAFDALALDFRAVIISDCCGSHQHQAHDATLSTYGENLLYPLFRILLAETFIAECDTRTVYP